MSLLDTASLIVTPNGYKEGTLYSVIPSDGSGDMSVVRATTATRVNSAGLVELVPYNFIAYSQEINNTGYWAHYLANITANTTTAPDGTTTADTIAITGTSGSAYQLHTYVGGVHTLSCYFKKINEDNVYMDGNSSSGYYGASFNLTTQAITLFGAGFSPSIESVGNGWYRCSVQGNGSGSGSYGFGVYASAGQSAYIWGAQLNEGTLKPYQKTETRLNIPRLDYSNGTCPSLLVEPQRTNVMLWSSSFDNAAWSNVSQVTTTANASTAPDGTMTADRLQCTGSNWFFAQPIFLTSGVSYTISMYVKSNTGSSQTFRLFGCNSLTSSNLTATNEWQRFEFTFTSTADFVHGIARNSSNDTADLLVWGAQLEAGSYPTSYIPTTSASVTRNADVVSKTGISSLIGQTEGTAFIDIQVDSSFAQANMRFLDISNNTYDNWYFLGLANTNELVVYFRSNATVYASAVVPITLGHNKIAFAYANNDYVAYLNGTLIHSDSSVVVGSTSKLTLGNDFDLSSPSKQFINATALWKTRLTNTQLAQLTTI